MHTLYYPKEANMKKLVIILLLVLLFFSLIGRREEGDFSKINAVLVSKIAESPAASEVFGLYESGAVET